MSAPLQTLLYGLDNAEVDQNSASLLFLNAKYSEGLRKEWSFQSFFKPDVDELVQHGFSVSSEISGENYDAVLCLFPKNMIEAQYMIAQALQVLSIGGTLICAAENKAGGSRLQKMLQQFSLSDISHESKNKCRVVWGKAISVNQNLVTKSLEKGSVQYIADNKFLSQPGVFGWNKIDKGSEILTRYIPSDIKGKGADFGCGYGFLAQHLMQNCAKVKHLICLDADKRAVDICAQNLNDYIGRFECVWADLTKTQKLPTLDFIVMNPPFHEGVKQDVEIGRKFVQNAYGSLRRGGRLWMVANAHLPYEDILNDIFFECTKHHEGQGFKVYEALK